MFVWSMGITQHRDGVANVRAIVDLALTRGFVGREKCGLMAIRGHSGVQGGAEVGAVPNQFPGGVAVDADGAGSFSKLWGFDVPDWRGMNAVEMIDAAHDGKLDVLYQIGGNFLETLPDPDYVREAVERIPFRVHQDIVLSPQMMVEPADAVVLLAGADSVRATRRREPKLRPSGAYCSARRFPVARIGEVAARMGNPDEDRRTRAARPRSLDSFR